MNTDEGKHTAMQLKNKYVTLSALTSLTTVSDEFIIGRVIKAMNFNWHPKCFVCELCNKELADLGFIRNAGRALCHECNARVKAESEGKYMCHKCQ